MNKEENKLFNSKTPEEYIENSLRSRLSPGKKASITRLWLNKNAKYTIDDIKYARNRHPHWKKKKMDGSLERNQQRQLTHNYSRGGDIVWNVKLIKKFISLNGKDASGKYVNRDHQLAKKFNTTIPAIQHYRRKYNLTLKILAKAGLKPSEGRLLEYISMSEKALREALKDTKKR